MSIVLGPWRVNCDRIGGGYVVLLIFRRALVACGRWRPDTRMQDDLCGLYHALVAGLRALVRDLSGSFRVVRPVKVLAIGVRMLVVSRQRRFVGI